MDLDPTLPAASPDPSWFKTTPYAHQLDAFRRSADAPYAALFMDPRTGTTQLTIDTAAHQFRRRTIDAMLVIAPNGVHVNWVREEIPAHMPIDVPTTCVIWRSGRMGTKAAREAIDEMLAFRWLAVLAVNVDALRTRPLLDLLTALFARRRVLAVMDESLDIANAGSKRSDIAMKIGRKAVSRRILDGTPAAATPLGLYPQTEFLKTGLLGFSSKYAFRARYARMEVKDFGERDKLCPVCRNVDPKRQPRMIDPLNPAMGTEIGPCRRCGGGGFVGRVQVSVVADYQNVEELHAKISAFAIRVRREDCADLPPKVYEKIYVEMTDEQRRVYAEMREVALAELRSGTQVTAPIVLTKYLRLQQIASNFAMRNPIAHPCRECEGAGCDACEETGFTWEERDGWEPVDLNRDARLEAAVEAVRRVGGQGIVWARFRHDAEAVTAALTGAGLRVVRYDGSASAEAREDGKRAFQVGDVDVIVGNQRAGGRGIDLSAASWVMYYSHDWGLRYRLQSEDRAQSLRRTTSVLYLDVVMEGTVDEKILKALRDGKSLSDVVMGETSGEWL